MNLKISLNRIFSLNISYFLAISRIFLTVTQLNPLNSCRRAIMVPLKPGNEINHLLDAIMRIVFSGKG